MISFEKVVCIKVRYNSGRMLLKNQLEHMAVLTDVPLSLLLQAQEKREYKVYVELKTTDLGSLEAKQIDFDKMPPLIKEQLSLIEPFKVPSEKVRPATRKPRKKTPKENFERTNKPLKQPEEKKENKISKEIVKSSNTNFKKEKISYDLNDILDKIGKVGVNKLTKGERIYLESLADKKALKENNMFTNPRTRRKNEAKIEDAERSRWDKLPKKSKGWRLPEIDELEALYHQLHKKGLGNFKDEKYWSATKFSVATVWYFDFKTGKDGTKSIKTTAYARYIK